MNPSDWISLTSAAFAGLAVLLPIVLKRIERRDKLARTKYLLELLKARRELLEFLPDEASSSEIAAISDEAKRILGKVDRAIATPEYTSNFGLFIAAAFVEAVLFIGAGLAELSETLRRLLTGPAWESRLYFLEGIFSFPVARIALLILCVSMSVGLTMKTSTFVQQRLKSYYATNLALLGIFNACLVVVVLGIGIVLAVLDPIIPWW